MLHGNGVYELLSLWYYATQTRVAPAAVQAPLAEVVAAAGPLPVSHNTTNADPCSAQQLHSVYTAYRLNDTIHNTLMRDSASCHDFDLHNGSRLLRHTSVGCNTASWVHCSRTYTKYRSYWELTSCQCDLHQMSFNESCQSSGDEDSPQTTNTRSLQMKWTNKHHTTIILVALFAAMRHWGEVK